MGLHVQQQTAAGIIALLEQLKPDHLTTVEQRDEDEEQPYEGLALPLSIVCVKKELVVPAGIVQPLPQDRTQIAFVVIAIKQNGNIHAALNALQLLVEQKLFGTRVNKTLNGLAKFGRIVGSETAVDRAGDQPVGVRRMQLEYVVRTVEGQPDAPLQVN